MNPQKQKRNSNFATGEIFGVVTENYSGTRNFLSTPVEKYCRNCENCHFEVGKHPSNDVCILSYQTCEIELLKCKLKKWKQKNYYSFPAPAIPEIKIEPKIKKDNKTVSTFKKFCSWIYKITH